MSSAPQVSLLVPTFNSGSTIKETLQSCLQQTFRDFEIIVYDETSRDRTREIVAGMAAVDPRIRLLTSEENSGPVRAWRKLLHEARGKWSTFVWSDDLLMPTFLEKMVGTLNENPSHLSVGCNAYTEEIHIDAAKPDGPLRAENRRKLFEYETVRLKGDEYTLAVLGGYFPVTPLCSLFSSKDAQDVFDKYIQIPNPYDIDFSRRAYGNDFTFLSEVTLRAGEIILLGEPLTVCRATPTSLTVNAKRTHHWQFLWQYVWAIRHGAQQCSHLSPRMPAVFRAADDRAHFCDTIFALQKGKLPHYCNPLKIARAVMFLLLSDRRTVKTRQPQTIQRWLKNKG